MDDPELIQKLRNNNQQFGDILWDILTPSERIKVLKRLEKKDFTLIERSETSKEETNIESVPIPQYSSPDSPHSPISPESSVATTSVNSNSEFIFERSVWNTKTLYQVAHADMIEQRTTIMKFLLMNYGIEAVERFFLEQNPQWAEQLKVGKVKKIFAKLISKLAPRFLMDQLAGIIIENAQYLVPLDHMTINEATDDYKIIEITKCPVLQNFKKTLKTLKFTDLEKRYVCSFACVPVLNQMASVGNCAVTADYSHDEKGCRLRVCLKAKEPEILSETMENSTVPLRNGPS